MSQRRWVSSWLFKDCETSPWLPFPLTLLQLCSGDLLLHCEPPHNTVAKKSNHFIMVCDSVGQDFSLGSAAGFCVPWCRLGLHGSIPPKAVLVWTILRWLLSYPWSLGRVDCMAELGGSPLHVLCLVFRGTPSMSFPTWSFQQGSWDLVERSMKPTQKLLFLSKASLGTEVGLSGLANKTRGRPIQFEFQINDINS